MKYEIPTCEIVKLDITDVITTSPYVGDGQGSGNLDAPIIPVI